jgi:ABC-type dipeptide/oligopeptide/nickel transport system ATPase component
MTLIMTTPEPVPTSATPTASAMLEISGLSGGFRAHNGDYTPVLDNVSFVVERGSMTAIVGETGSGKSMTMLSVLGLTPRTFERTAGRITFEGRPIDPDDERAMRSIRGAQIATVFQNSRAALNPVFSIGSQLIDVLRLHRGLSKQAARATAAELLASVYISEPQRRLKQYPHELSGGTAQRVQIALALACEPRLLILDEPTTGLDVTIQADILDLIVELGQSRGMTTALITHDLGVVAQTCDRMVVMRSGQVLETGRTERLMTSPSHAYTQQLLESSRLGEGTR